MTTASETALTVLIEHSIADSIDHLLSPMDGAIALAQIETELPRLHRPRKSRFGLTWRWSIPLYRGLLEWCGVEIVYVELGGTFHVLDGQCSDHTRITRYDAILPMPSDDYVTETKSDRGVSILAT